jgi:hypothetical protein
LRNFQEVRNLCFCGLEYGDPKPAIYLAENARSVV